MIDKSRPDRRCRCCLRRCFNQVRGHCSSSCSYEKGPFVFGDGQSEFNASRESEYLGAASGDEWRNATVVTLMRCPPPRLQPFTPAIKFLHQERSSIQFYLPWNRFRHGRSPTMRLTSVNVHILGAANENLTCS